MDENATPPPGTGPSDPAAEAEPVTASEGAPSPSAAMAGGGYRVALDSYSGPLDLLLYLIRKEEVAIQDIPVARIAEQYQQYIELMAQINVNVAGEFLVMAATLMEIKSRMLLPREEGLEEEEEDPRGELVRQLLEYKRYKDVARELGVRAAEQALKFSRPGAEALPAELQRTEEGEETPGEALDGVGLWELIDAFAKVLSETSVGPPQTRVLERERPVHEFRRALLAIVTARREVRFSQIFAECRSRDEMIAMFIALLELVRLHRLRLQQAARFSEIYVCQADDSEVARTHAAQAAAEAVEAEAGEPEPPGTSGAIRHPDALREADVLQKIEEEDDSLGRARHRIDAALAKVESFLKQHHEQVGHQQVAREESAEGAHESDAGGDVEPGPPHPPDAAPGADGEPDGEPDGATGGSERA